MRLTAKKSVFRLVAISTFILLLIFKGILPQPVYALLSSLDACAVQAECAATGSELAPTTKAAINITKAQNERVPNKAQERYCSFYPLNLVCGPQGQSSVFYNYKFHQTVHYRRSGSPDKFVTHHFQSWRPAPGAIISLANKSLGREFGGGYPPSGDYVTWIHLNDGDGNNQTRGVVYEYSTGDTMTWDDYANYSNNNVEGEWISDVVLAEILPDNSSPHDRKD
ncbi:hypothetical protein [Nostoc sp. 'Peltigera malacea cyanobiont' DB3992]|uniref:hypothetical protein n=1 Tax=Nostoc sp. 'Peltigera malacea cyanobiont' DB3992 TaxID=1206980 RepID=UPI000C0493CE|nr:hypothetical protein [Nostoc sp. 'Peltigera malacea cyanobiont' DB3992]PHM07080.1 hypothetical protein CK516_29280 [Nostoc sp. 'Peltigera malacea cyanobiont' DB3992]